VNIETVARSPVRVAARRYVGPPGEPLGRFWRNKFTCWLADNGMVDCPRYGVARDDPRSTPPERFRYDCCVELPPRISIAGADELEIPGGRFAVTRFKGTGALIGAAWEEFVTACLARGFPLDCARPPFEHYPRGASYDTKTGVFTCELCLPLAGDIDENPRERAT
jgi:AraC family transcriptional regulator